MNCPNCGAVCEERSRFCGACGAALTFEKKGSHRVPIIIMLVLSILGTCVFFATGGTSADPQAPTDNTDTFFIISNGAVSANPDTLWGQEEITVPETVNGQIVTGIDADCFSSFPFLTEVHLPDSVTGIGSSAFAFCKSLRGIDLPPGLTDIEDLAFRFCGSLEAIHIPITVEHIGDDVFLGCDSLAFIFYDGTIAQWEALYPYELYSQTAVCCTDGTFYQD